MSLRRCQDTAQRATIAWTSPSSETGSSKSNIISLPSPPLRGILVTTPIWHCFVNGWNRILVREWSTPEEQTSWAAGVRAYALRSLAHTSYSYGVGNLLALRLGLRLCCKHIQVMTTTFKRRVNQQKTMGKPGSNNKELQVLASTEWTIGNPTTLCREPQCSMGARLVSRKVWQTGPGWRREATV